MNVSIKANQLLAMQEFVSENKTRLAMNGVNIEATDKVILRATDGHVAGKMVLDDSMHEGEGSFTLSPSKEHLKMLKAVKCDFVVLTLNGESVSALLPDGTTLSIPVIGLTFPNYDQVYPDDNDGAVDDITINPKLLMKFYRCKALLEGGKTNGAIKIVFHKDNISPMSISFDEYGFKGLLMPMRV